MVLAAQQRNKLIKFQVCAKVGQWLVCFSPYIFCHRLARSTSKLHFLFGNFSFGVLHRQKCYVMFQCIAVLSAA